MDFLSTNTRICAFFATIYPPRAAAGFCPWGHGPGRLTPKVTSG